MVRVRRAGPAFRITDRRRAGLPTLPLCPVADAFLLASGALCGTQMKGVPVTPNSEFPLAINVQCPHCRGVCQIADQHAGKTVQCGRCKKPFAVRACAPRGRVRSPGSTGRAPPPPAAASSAIDEEVLPTWDEPVINALLGTNSGPITTRTLPILAVTRLDLGSGFRSARFAPATRTASSSTI